MSPVRCLHNLGCADDGVGLRVIEPWISALFPALDKAYKRALEIETASSSALQYANSRLTEAQAPTTTKPETPDKPAVLARPAPVTCSSTLESGDGASTSSSGENRSRVLPLPVISALRPDVSDQRRRTHLVSDGEHRLVVVVLDEKETNILKRL